MARLNSNPGEPSAGAKVTNSCWHCDFSTTGQTLPGEGESFLKSFRAARTHVGDLSRSELRKPSDLLGGTGLEAPAGYRSLLSIRLLLGIYIYIYIYEIYI